MLNAFSRSVRLWVLPAVIAALGCAGRRAHVRSPRPEAEVVVVEAPATLAPPVERVVVEPVAEPVAAPTRVVTELASRAPGSASIENWAARYPDAARGLGAWAHDNPEAARFVFEYDGRHPDRNRELILWAIYHPSDDVALFAAKHPGWEWFDTVMKTHRAGADQFLQWARSQPVAAEELVGHPSGLLWAGDHLYAAEWKSRGGH